MFWSLQVTRDALWRCKKVYFPEKLVCKDRPMSFTKNASTHQIILTFMYFSSSRAWQLGKAQAQHLFQWMLFEKGQNFKSSRPFRPDLCPVLLVNHWRKISVCISTFFQSFSIAWTFSTSNAASEKSAPIGERRAFYFTAKCFLCL